MKSYVSFWSKNPALFIGISLLLGTAIAFHPHPLFGVIFLTLCLIAPRRSILIIALLCFTGALLSVTFRHPKTLLPQEKNPGIGIFHIEKVSHYSSPFHRSLQYQGTLKSFKTTGGEIFKDLPCNIYMPLFNKRPIADTDYEIRGNLCQKGDYVFVLKPDKKHPWLPIPSYFNLSELRFLAKQATSLYLKKQIADPHARTFLNALAIGDIDERILSMEFGKVGLLHILAISGFHFALAALFLNFIFRSIFPDKISAILLICAISFYYLLLGNAPSIQRAYITIFLIAVGQLFSLKISGLNALGVGLIVEILFHPLVVTKLSFQLTFLCTLAILLFYPLIHRAFKYLLPERPYSETRSMSLLDKHAFLLLVMLRKTLALNFAVHLISLPVLLHIFHKFPLLSLAYNLFFPACAALSMLLLFTAFFFAPLLPFLSHAIHTLNNAWTSCILNLTTNPPALLDFSIRTREINFPLVICFLSLAFFLGSFFYEKEHANA